MSQGNKAIAGGPHPASVGQNRIAVWLGRLVIAAAIWSLLAIFARRGRMALIGQDLFGLFGIPVEPTPFVVALLLVLAGAIRRRLRAARLVMLVAMMLSVLDSGLLIANAVYKWASIDELTSGVAGSYFAVRLSVPFVAISLVVQLLAFIALAWARPAFPARLSRGSLFTAVGVLVAGIVTSFLVTLVLTALAPGSLSGWKQRLLWAFRSAIGMHTPADHPMMHGHRGPVLLYGLAGLLSGAAVVLALMVFWRSGANRPMQSAPDELHVRRLLLQHGELDSLGYFATRRDKSVVFSPDGNAAITYRIEGTVSVASGDPVGDPESWSGAIESWVGQTRENGWYPAVLAASEAGAQAYARAGLRAFALGDEAILDLDRFNLSGRSMKPVRHAVARVRGAGYTAKVRRHADLTPDELAALARYSEEWRDGDTERGYSMALNRVGDPSDGRCVVVTAHDGEGAVRGFLSFVPWGRRGISLDLMRRDPDAGVNGLTEFLVASLAEHAPDQGIRRVSLNFAMFREVFAEAGAIGAGPIDKLNVAALGVASKFFQLESLYRSNDKYQPDWVPRLMCYDPSLTATRAGIAMGTAEGFLPRLGPSFLHGPRPAERQEVRPEPFNELVATQERELLTLAPEPVRTSEQQRVRQAKIALLEAHGMPAYPVRVPRTARAGALRRNHRGLAPDTVTTETVSLAGRVRALRDFGGVTFADLQDGDDHLQVIVSAEALSTERHDLWRRAVDIGDIVSVTGPVATSRTGELSVLASDWCMAAKCLHPLPRVRARLSEDVRVRNRSLDLLVNPDGVDILARRSLAVRAVRRTLEDRGFLEVETPMLQAVHGGASARPFETHINAYNMDLVLRIAPELYLKRLAVGGMQRVFELNRNFRNEGADATHNPEFTSLEVYEAYSDFEEMQDLTRALVLAAATAVHGRPVCLRPDGAGGMSEVDLDVPWPSVRVHDAVSAAVGVPVTTATPAAELARICRDRGLDVPPDASPGKLVMELYEEFVEGATTMPTFYRGFPVEISPLARRDRTDPLITEHWDLVCFGTELGTAYSELNDPLDQRQRLTAQSFAAAAGDAEAMELDEDFLAALELGMPPTGGMGMGIDRLVMFLAGTSIRPTLAFPFVRPKE